jgi:hypothetical protein
MKYALLLFSAVVTIGQVSAEDKSQESAFQIQTRYLYAHRAHNCYSDSSGDQVCRSGDLDRRFLGLGFRYLYKPIEFFGFGIEPYGEILVHARRQNASSLRGGQIGVEGSYTLLAHSPVIGVFFSRMTEPDSSLRFRPALGARVGYRYFLGEHLIGGTYEWMRFRSENPPSVNDQITRWTVLSLIYAYTF